MAVIVVATLIVLAGTAAGCGDEPESDEPPTRATVCEVVEGSAQGEVVVRGAGRALSPGLPGVGFSLSAGGCSILVAAHSFEAVHARGGLPVEVHGLASPLEPRESERLTVRSQPSDLDEPRFRVAVGAPFIDAFSVTGEYAFQRGSGPSG